MSVTYNSSSFLDMLMGCASEAPEPEVVSAAAAPENDICGVSIVVRLSSGTHILVVGSHIFESTLEFVTIRFLSCLFIVIDCLFEPLLSSPVRNRFL